MAAHKLLSAVIPGNLQCDCVIHGLSLVCCRTKQCLHGPAATALLMSHSAQRQSGKSKQQQQQQQQRWPLTSLQRPPLAAILSLVKPYEINCNNPEKLTFGSRDPDQQQQPPSPPSSSLPLLRYTVAVPSVTPPGRPLPSPIQPPAASAAAARRSCCRSSSALPGPC
jgi:hypothetical protein